MNIKYDDLTKLFAIEQAKETSYRSTLRQSLASFLSLCDKADISVDTKTELKYICNYINDIVKYFEKGLHSTAFSKMKKADVIKTLKQNSNKTEIIDTRAYLDINEFKALKDNLEKLYNKAPVDKIDEYLKKVINSKRSAVLKNMGICVGALGVAVPLLMIAMRYILPNNKEYKVMEQAKKETSSAKAA